MYSLTYAQIEVSGTVLFDIELFQSKLLSQS